MKIITIDELLKMLDAYDHAELHMHHTWKPAHSSFNGSNHIKVQTGMKNTHININGWSDIGQHVTLFPDGKFVTGRDFSKAPASIVGKNVVGGKPAFCVEMVGNFDIKGTGQENNLGYDKLEGVQLDSIVKLAKYFHKKGKYIRFHRENAPKTCPGTGIDKKWFMSLVEKKEEVVMEIKKERFSDIGQHWAKEVIEKVASEGLMNGYTDGTFKPDRVVTRAELASILAKLIK